MPVTFHKATLPNGLTILGEVDPSAHSAAAGFFVRTGARDEAREVMGVSHFLEHMMFKGTDDLSAEDLNRAFDQIGARNNAFTSTEMTCFYAHVLPEHLTSATDLLCRMMRPALRSGDFDTEKGVILEEIAMYKDNPFWVLYEATVEKHFGESPLSHRVLGTTESITALAQPQMRAYFDNRYSADNTVVALAGKLDFDALVSAVAHRCGDWSATGVGRDSTRHAPAGGTLHLRDEKVSRAYMLGLAEAPGIADERRHAAALLAQVLGGPDNSRLHWALIETGLADEAQSSYDGHDGFGDTLIYLSCDPARADEAWAVADREMRNLADSLTEDDLDRLRAKVATAAVLAGERPEGRMHRLGRIWTMLGRYETLEDELAAILRVSLDDLRDVARDFPIIPQTVGRLTPP